MHIHRSRLCGQQQNVMEGHAEKAATTKFEAALNNLLDLNNTIWYSII